MKRRVVITGQGAISPLGRDTGETLTAMREGRSGIGPLAFQDVERLAIAIGGQIRDYRPEDHFSRQELTLYDKFTQFALLAAREAVAASGLEVSEALAEQAIYSARLLAGEMPPDIEEVFASAGARVMAEDLGTVPDFVRASLVRMANALVAGHQGVRPEVAQALVATLEKDAAPRVHSLGTVGEADLAQTRLKELMAHLPRSLTDPAVGGTRGAVPDAGVVRAPAEDPA